MTRTIIAGLAALALGACGGNKVEGKVVDGRTGQAMGGFTLKASAAEDTNMTCQYFEAEVADDGSFLFESLCSGVPYNLESSREDIWLADGPSVPAEGIEGATEFKVWNAPKGSGIWRVPAGGDLQQLKTTADIKQESLKESDEVVHYPSNIPKNVPLVAGNDVLLIVGNPAEMLFKPLIYEADVRKFGDEQTNVKMDPWWYVGKRFSDHSVFEVVEATVDAGQLADKSDATRAARWMNAGALPAGRYAVHRADDRRMYIIDFGEAQAEAE